MALAAWWVAPFVPGVGTIVLALLIGAVVGNAGGADGALAAGIKVAETTLLAVAIGLLGFGLDLTAVLGLGLVALPTLAVVVAGAVGLAAVLGPRLFGLSPALSLLVGAGQGICGTAAIAATGPVVGASDEETGVAVGVVNLLGTVGLLLLPPLALALGLDGDGAGLVLGGSLQSVGHAVAAGFGVSEPVGTATTMVKLGRVALLPVVLLGIGLTGQGQGARTGLPREVVAFVVAAAVASTGWLPASLLDALDTLTDALLAVSMAAIGTKIRLASLRSSGTGALGLGATVFAAQVLLVTAVAVMAL